MRLLETHSVRKEFDGVVAIAGVDLTVEAGEVVGLIGANGAGKTTLIRMCLGILAPTSGSVSLFGAPPSRATRRRMGYVPQGSGLYDDLTVGENLDLVARAFGARLDDLGDMDPVRHRLVGELSLGIRRRVAFRAARLHEPQLLVLDEPTSGVGPLGRARLWDEIRAEAQRGAGVLVTTHHMSEAEQCDRVVVLADGHVVADGALDEVVSGEVVEVRADSWADAFTALDDAGYVVSLVGTAVHVIGASPAEVRAALDRAEVTAAMGIVDATFEEAFVALTRGRAA